MMLMVNAETLKELVAGSGVGSFVGDALGMPVEGFSPVHIEALYGRLDRMVPGRLPAGSYTDDTQMMVAILEALVQERGFSPHAVAMRFVANFDPVRGYGGRIAGVMSRLAGGVSWRDAGTDSFGNGAAMRIAPIGLFFFDDLDGLKRAARECSIITHRHPEGVAGGVAQALGVALALRAGISGERPVPGDFLDAIARGIGELDEGFAQRLAGLADLDRENLKAGIRELFSCSVKAVDAVPPALACFLFTDSFKDALVAAVGLGGDTDTIGAMTGALAGAFYGKKAIPRHWLDALEEGVKGKTYMEGLLMRLAEICLART